MSLGKDIKANFEYEGEEDKLENMSAEANVYDDSDEKSSSLEEIAQPVEIVREEVVTLTKNPNAEIYSEERMSMVGKSEEEADDDYYDGNIYHLVKAHSAELSSLTAKVESLQSEINQLEEATISGNKSISPKAAGIKTKKKKKNKGEKR
jgi:hypothetical protein